MEAPFDAPLDGLFAEREAVAGLARRLSGRDLHAAEDLEQEVWAAALARPPREATSLRGWLRVVTRSRSVERLRRRGRAGRAEREAARSEAVEGADEALARRDQALRLAHALRELEEPYRSVIVLRFVEDLAPRDVARRLGRPVETVRTQTRRGLILLRHKLEARPRRDSVWGLVLLALLALRRPRASSAFAALAAVSVVVVLAVALSRPRGGAAGAAAPLGPTPAEPTLAASAPVVEAERSAALAAAPDAREQSPLPALWVDVALTDERGLALAGADVRVESHAGARPAGRTDARGRLRVPLDLSDLASAHPGWLLESDAVELSFAAAGRATRNAFVFLPDAGGTQLELALAHGARELAGRLLDADGRPLAGVQLEVGPALGVGGRERLDPDGRAVSIVRALSAESDADGRFALEGLPREPLRLAAWAAGHALAALEIDLEDADVELRLERAEPLRGLVRLGGAPAPGAVVEWSALAGPAWPADWCRASADGEGRFELPRPAQGTLALLARGDGAAAEAELVLGDEPPTWTAELARAPGLAVRLLEADGRAAAGLYLCLRSAADGAVLAAAESDAQGRAHFATESAGPCDLVVLPSRGAGTWPREVVTDLPGAGGPELVLRLAPEGAGTAALAARFEAGSEARLVLRHVAGMVEHAAAPDEAGRLAWDALPAGRWSARALLGEGRERELGEFELAPGETLDLGRIESLAPVD